MGIQLHTKPEGGGGVIHRVMYVEEALLRRVFCVTCKLAGSNEDVESIA